MISLGPLGFSNSQSQGQSKVEEIMNQSVKKYEFSVGREHGVDGEYGGVKSSLAPLRYNTHNQ